MRISIKKGKSLDVRVHFTLSGEQIEQELTPQLHKISRTARVRGFRHGKVPIATVKQMYGASIREQAIERLAGEAVTQALQDKKLDPVARPSVESRKDNSDGSVKMIALFEVYPQVVATRYRKIRVKKQMVSVEQGDVDDFIERLRRQPAVANNKEGADKSAAQPSDAKQTTPESLAPLNDEFYAKYGVHEGGEAKFREVVLVEINARVKNYVAQDMRTQLLDQLLQQYAKMLVPQALVEQELGAMRSKMDAGSPQDKTRDNVDLPEELLTSMREQAQRRVKLALIMRHLVEDLTIKADADSVRQYIEERVGDHPQRDEVINWYYNDESALRSAESAVVEGRLIETLLTKVKVSEVSGDCRSILYPKQEESPSE